jgi:hypothetical protein
MNIRCVIGDILYCRFVNALYVQLEYVTGTNAAMFFVIYGVKRDKSPKIICKPPVMESYCSGCKYIPTK